MKNVQSALSMRGLNVSVNVACSAELVTTKERSQMARKLDSDGDWTHVADADLVLAFQSGVRNAFNEIDRRFRPRLLRFLRSRVNSTETAEDLTQETILRAFSALDSVRNGVFLAGWLKRIAYRTYIDWLRKSSREDGFLSFDENETNEGGENVCLQNSVKNPKRPSGGDFSVPAPDSRVNLKDECDNVWRVAREILSPVEFQVLWLRYADGLDDSETALSLGKSPGAVRTSLSRARARLFKAFKTRETNR